MPTLWETLDRFGMIPEILAHDFSDEQRKKLAKSGKAMPHGGFPIVTRGDVENAVRAIGRAKNRAVTISHIISRARALGAMDAIPKQWLSSGHEKRKQEVAAWGSGGGHKLPNPSHNPTSRVKKFGHKFPNSSIGGHPQNVRTVI